MVTSLTERSPTERSVAHDVTNAFAAVQGAGWLLGERWADMSGAQRADMLDIIMAGSDRLAKVFTGLLLHLPPDVTDQLRAMLDKAAAERTGPTGVQPA